MEDCLIKTILDIKTGEIVVKDPGFKVVFEDGSYKIIVDVPSSNCNAIGEVHQFLAIREELRGYTKELRERSDDV